MSPRTEFYQVFGNFPPARGFSVSVFQDLSIRQLKANFVKPYGRGEQIRSGTSIYDLNSISEVRIIRTETRLSEIFRIMECRREAASERRRQEEQTFFGTRISMPILANLAPNFDQDLEDAISMGHDVTREFIHSAPGQAWTLTKFLSHPISNALIALAVSVLGTSIVILWLGQ